MVELDEDEGERWWCEVLWGMKENEEKERRETSCEKIKSVEKPSI